MHIQEIYKDFETKQARFVIGLGEDDIFRTTYLPAMNKYISSNPTLSLASDFSKSPLQVSYDESKRQIVFYVSLVDNYADYLHSLNVTQAASGDEGYCGSYKSSLIEGQRPAVMKSDEELNCIAEEFIADYASREFVARLRFFEQSDEFTSFALDNFCRNFVRILKRCMSSTEGVESNLLKKIESIDTESNDKAYRRFRFTRDEVETMTRVLNEQGVTYKSSRDGKDKLLSLLLVPVVNPYQVAFYVKRNKLKKNVDSNKEIEIEALCSSEPTAPNSPQKQPRHLGSLRRLFGGSQSSFSIFKRKPQATDPGFDRSNLSRS